MVSSINTIRIWSQQAALSAFKEASSESNQRGRSASDASPTLANILYPGNSSSDDDYEDTKLTALIASLQQAMNGGDAGDEGTDGSVGDMSSNAFMKALREKLEGLKGNPDTKAMADKMLAALDAGTLTVTNVVAGEKITAWDTTDSKPATNDSTSVEKSDWSSFLKDLLTRDTSGKFVRNADSSYIEKTSGASSYFGMVADAYYYISWTNPPAKPTPGTVTTM